MGGEGAEEGKKAPMNECNTRREAGREAGVPWQKLKVKYQLPASKAAELTRWT